MVHHELWVNTLKARSEPASSSVALGPGRGGAKGGVDHLRDGGSLEGEPTTSGYLVLRLPACGACVQNSQTRPY